MNHQPLIYLVSVEYGNWQDAAHEKLLKRYSDQFKCIVIRVRTDCSPGVGVANLNEAFEFSGYQDGLSIALNEMLLSPNEALCTIVFINDTWLVGHLKLLARELVNALVQLRYQPNSPPIFTGLQMPTVDSIASITNSSAYISTWAFALVGPVEIFKNIHFYNSNEVSGIFENNYFELLPSEYRQEIEAWLKPTHILKGWYKSTLGKSLDESTLHRKLLTIYLEHSLPSKLALQGFKCCDIGGSVSKSKALFINSLRILDRIYVIYLKLRTRISLFLGF